MRAILQLSFTKMRAIVKDRKWLVALEFNCSQK